ncbi:DnaB-like helicase N-terminal domain-containing protein [Actinomadura atramentaria]|uniref:DnaB-like helicase N-terminal domain-containing protein n=1 Tax=Actinomadura atramentaria TaxID=1990 RepID=UPI00036B9753|nr:DnaB-like helicase N-terminal domain-containing protein [Actinomadura atramentaria]
MPDLLHRVEEQLLGALIHDPSLVVDVPYLRASDFGDPDHALIFEALLAERSDGSRVYGIEMAERIVTRSGHAHITETRLTELVLNAPDVVSIGAYGRMLQEAALYADLARHAERLARTAGTERDATSQHKLDLSQALSAHNSRFEAALRTTFADGAIDQDTRLIREDYVLADLVQHPEQVQEVDWLDRNLFSAGRREIFDAIIEVDRYGEPVNDLTVAWELVRTRAANDFIDRTTEPTTIAPGHLARLASIPVQAGIAVELGREMMSDHIRTTLTTEITRTDPALNFQQANLSRTQEMRAPLLSPPDRNLGIDGPELRH